MNNNPLVSVIIPCFNKGRYLEETLNSVFNQTYQNFEVVIVNDGSTDEFTNTLLQNANWPKTRIIHTKNQGVVAARNTAVLNSSGKYILPMDGDDPIEPQYMEEAVELLEKDPKLKVVYCDADFFGEINGKWDLPEYSFEKLLETNIIFVTAFSRREDFDAIGGWNPNTQYFFEDWDFFIATLERGGTVFKIPKTYFHYRRLPTSRTDALLNEEKTRKALRQVYLNHTEAYAKYFQDPLTLKRDVTQLQKYRDNYYSILNGASYRIGSVLTAPVRMIKSIFKK